ncbi:MAG: hypothetical protein HZA16_06705 [Nitrospirae bacterium]|nr:hypothetical protein [Nitrospirota bacterium]
MKEILNYNFNPTDIRDEDFSSLFQTRRRDSTFAFVYEKDGFDVAVRDHLGIVPLYYRYHGDGFRYSTNLSDLVLPDDEIDELGLKYLLAFGTPRLHPLIKDIGAVPPGSAVKLDRATGERHTLYQYRIRPEKMSFLNSMDGLTERMDRLFYSAVKRLVKFDTVGIYLSGGMDSSLIGVYLKKMGVGINAYTSASEGTNSDEIKKSRRTAEFLNVRSHHVGALDCNNAEDVLSLVAGVYGIPHGTTLSIAVGSLWRNTPIGNERQIFFGQNSDTMTCSVGIQVRMYFRQFIPDFLRKSSMVYLDRAYKLRTNDVLKNYIYLRSKGLVDEYPLIHEVCDVSKASTLQLLTIAGMYFGHTPNDSEDMSQPAISRNIIVSNPYYDMDLIEFNLGIPARCRLSLMPFTANLGKNIRLVKPIFKKRVIRKLALKHLPDDLVNKKKGFTVSLKDTGEAGFIADLPVSIHGIELDNVQSRVTAGVFQSWCRSKGIRTEGGQ